jgi:antitoxin HicB
VKNERRRRLRGRIAQHPKTVRFEELCRLLEAYGWTLDRTSGSHHVYRQGGTSITVPFRRRCSRWWPRRTRPRRMSMATSDTAVRVQELLARPYRMEVRGDPDEGYLATAPELPGCMTAGETPAEALELLRDAMAGWFESAIAHDDPIPAPAEASKDSYSGRLLLRMPKSLHRDLAKWAEREGVSLNQHVVSVLSAAVGAREAATKEAAEMFPSRDRWARLYAEDLAKAGLLPEMGQSPHK